MGTKRHWEALFKISRNQGWKRWPLITQWSGKKNSKALHRFNFLNRFSILNTIRLCKSYGITTVGIMYGLLQIINAQFSGKDLESLQTHGYLYSKVMCHRQPCPLFSVQVDHNGTISEHYWEQCQHLKSSSLHTAYILTAGWVDRVLDRGKGKHFDSLGNSLDSAPKPRVWVLSSSSWSQELRLCDPCEPLLTQDILWFHASFLPFWILYSNAD